MLLSINEVVNLISEGKNLHIAGSESLLKKLPKGNWIGGSTEYFMTEDGGIVTDEKLFVKVMEFENIKYATYDENDISSVTSDAFDSGFSIVIIPFDSKIHIEYAEHAAEFPEMFLKNIVGWISGFNLNKENQTAIAVNGQTGEILTDKAAVMHIETPEDKTVSIGMINIFEKDENSPLIEFAENGFSTKSFLIDGHEVGMVDFINNNSIDTKLPIIGDYSGAGVNISAKEVIGDTVTFYAPIFNGIKYHAAKRVDNYEEEFASRLAEANVNDYVFSCNCILNFLYGELEGKAIGSFYGPITFGEISYQLVNQTLVYVTLV